MNATVKRIGTIAAGSVLFFLLGRYVTIPSPIPTVNICVQYGLLAFLAVACGPLTGSMTGLIGHILIDLSGGQMFWSWIIATTAFGGLLGVLANVTRLDPAHRDREMLVHFNLCQVATHVVCWAGIAPVLDILFYNENMDTIFAEGLTAALSNAVTTAIMAPSLLAAGTLKEPMLKALPATFSWPQLITALIGGAVALVIVPVIRKALHK